MESLKLYSTEQLVGELVLRDYTAMKKRLCDLLFDFVQRVAKGETTSETEVEVLPEIVSELCTLIQTPSC